MEQAYIQELTKMQPERKHDNGNSGHLPHSHPTAVPCGMNCVPHNGRMLRVGRLVWAGLSRMAELSNTRMWYKYKHLVPLLLIGKHKFNHRHFEFLTTHKNTNCKIRRIRIVIVRSQEQDKTCERPHFRAPSTSRNCGPRVHVVCFDILLAARRE